MDQNLAGGVSSGNDEHVNSAAATVEEAFSATEADKGGFAGISAQAVKEQALGHVEGWRSTPEAPRRRAVG